MGIKTMPSAYRQSLVGSLLVLIPGMYVFTCKYFSFLIIVHTHNAQRETCRINPLLVGLHSMPSVGNSIFTQTHSDIHNLSYLHMHIYMYMLLMYIYMYV